ncbi:MAG: HAD hydrolase family protein [Clostridiales bacterium]|nr:HAD hydrolase family protein [Clostridiales bacterium]
MLHGRKIWYNKKRSNGIHIGQRIIKTAVAVFLCFVIFDLRGQKGIPFYAAIAAMLCMQPYAENSSKAAKERMMGTLMGALYGSIVLVIYYYFGIEQGYISYIIVSLTIILIINTTIYMKIPQVSYFSCVVFLSIAANHMTDEQPFLFVADRVTDTFIGIIVSLGVNAFRFPRHRRDDILFISGMDDALLNEDGKMDSYTKVELNRMIERGASFTVSTARTPIALMEPLRNVKLNLPVVAMDGAVLYDINTNRYLKVCALKKDTVWQLQSMIRKESIGCFYYTVMQDVLLIYLERFENLMMQDMFQSLKRNPYGNYICKELPEDSKVIYLYLVDTKEKIKRFMDLVKTSSLMEEVRLTYGADERYGGFTYLRIYDKDATRENMNAYLKHITGTSETVCFGKLEGGYVVPDEKKNRNAVVKGMKAIYEPYIWQKEPYMKAGK